MSVPEVLARLRDAEAGAGRAPGSARLVAMTKGHPLPEIEARILTHGAFALGENRAQELRDKAAALPDAEWHFTGPLQRNKVKYLRPVTLVHAIEEAWQAQAIADAAAGWGRAPGVLLQVHNGEAQKHGADAADVPALLREVQATGLSVRGLMVMAPDLPDKGDPARPAAEERVLALFEDTARRAHALGLSELSMGMSGDYPLAVRAGATLVRVGRSLFA